MEVGRQFLQCQTNSEAFGMIQERRSGNYKPNIWKYEFLQSLSSTYDEEKYKTQAERLKEDAKHLFVEAVDLEAKLELVDCIRKVGLESHFQNEIKKTLDAINNDNYVARQNLYVTALCFRLLRQQGYEVSQDVFRNFLDEMGTFMKGKSLDMKGVLELFEASHLGLEGENILDDAKAFSTRILKDIKSTTSKSNLYKYILHALELPFHWRVRWFDVKWQISKFAKDKDKDKNINKIFLDLAKVNFHIVQATLQKDLKEISRWWRNLGLIENLNFSRDRLVESFLCTVGLVFETQYSSFRKWLTKVVIMILVIDDVYDIYGSLEELQHFTNAISRWDKTEVAQLPECMRICFEALQSITNETAHEIQSEKGWDQAQTSTHLKKVWADFCEALFVEAKWYNKGYTPSLHEYLNTACVSSSGSLLSVHSFFSIMNQGTKDILHFLETNQDLLHNISLIIRLCNDLGTSVAEQERGDAASSIVCVMREMKVSEKEARTHIKGMIGKLWKKINVKCITQPPDLQLFVNININMARVVHNLYQNRDGFGVQDTENKKQILSLLVDPLGLD